MSNINIKRAIENINSRTNVYTPLVEVIVNAIDAIDERKSYEKVDGLVEIYVNRSNQQNIEESKTDISGFTVKDNGVGFTKKNRNSFDTLYTERKIKKGGKGFGRFVCLKHFEDFQVESIFREGDEFFYRNFKMGKNQDIIVDEEIGETDKKKTGTTVHLISIKRNFPEATISTISRTLVEKLLPFFVEDSYECPTIKLVDSEEESMVLNDYVKKPSKVKINEIKSASGNFKLESQSGKKKSFTARVFKIYSPKSSRSKISLVAHHRVVTSTSLHNYIPEFKEEFYDSLNKNGRKEDRIFIINVYVFGDYLDRNVSVDRDGFEFKKEKDLFYGISQKGIEKNSSMYAYSAVKEDVSKRRKKTKEIVDDYVREAPWYRTIKNKVDYSDLPYKPSPNQIESYLHKKKHENEVQVKHEVNELLASDKLYDIKDKAKEIAQRITDTSKNELSHYISLRKSVLEIFEKSLQVKENNKYESEDIVHGIIFPTKEDSESTPFEDHNLWIIDERLNFTDYLTSDKPLDGPRSDRPDILAFDKRIGFRGENVASNPVTIFEFKKPQRDDFVNESKEDPVQQIIRYVMSIQDGEYSTPKGRNIHVGENTPFYGYVVCDISNKISKWASKVKDFKMMPDGLGFFKRHDHLNLYIEILSWDKVLRDAQLRNKVFFQKLNIV